MNRLLIVALALGLTETSPRPAIAAGRQQSEIPPTNASEIIAKVRNYAAGYIDRLPNFICTQTTTHSSAGKKGERWHRKDIQTAQLVFAEGKEKRTVQAVNGKAVLNGRWRGGRNELTTEGEFGILLANILGPDSWAEITWGGFENVRGQNLAVVRYSVDQEHSTLRLSRDYLASAFVAYYGEVFADPTTGAVVRITKQLSDIPPELETENSRTVIDYEKIAIGGTDYLLPSAASVEMTIRSGRLRNEMSFEGYRKFEASSTITFQP
ncbi:MAG: hypothetical protein ACJ746_12960 [Bryobacteraceae bacterium]